MHLKLCLAGVVAAIVLASSAAVVLASHDPVRYIGIGYDFSNLSHNQCSSWAPYVCWTVNENNLVYNPGSSNLLQFNGLNDYSTSNNYFACWGIFRIYGASGFYTYNWYNTQPLSQTHTLSPNQWLTKGNGWWPVSEWQIIAGPGSCSDAGSYGIYRNWVF